MSAHDHSVRVAGCFRCEMTPDEVGVAAEDRGVQVEARTLSGVHIGQRVSVGEHVDRKLVVIEHSEDGVALLFAIDDRRGTQQNLDPTDLVTLTNGGAR